MGCPDFIARRTVAFFLITSLANVRSSRSRLALAIGLLNGEPVFRLGSSPP